jgi:guanylate kinase
MIAGGEFLECAEVFGNLSGTASGANGRIPPSRSDLDPSIDLQAARTVRPGIGAGARAAGAARPGRPRAEAAMSGAA